MSVMAPDSQSYLAVFTALDLAAVQGKVGEVNRLLDGADLNNAPEGMIASRFPDLIARAEKEYPAVADALKNWRRWCQMSQQQAPRPVSGRVVRKLDFS